MVADLSVFTALTPDGDHSWGGAMLLGAGLSLALMAMAWALALSVGIAVGVLRCARSPVLRAVGRGYVELFRNIPLLVQFFVWYFLVPELSPTLKRLVTTVDPLRVELVTAVVCLGLFTAARVAEQVRAGIQALPAGQLDAARALGLRAPTRMVRVLLPQALRIVLPTLGSEAMNLLKNTSVAYSIGLPELFFRTREMGEQTFAFVAAFAAATLVYGLLALALAQGFTAAERALRLPGQLTGRA